MTIVDLDELEAIDEDGDLADALDQLGRALKAFEDAGYRIGFNWYEQRWTPGQEPSNFAIRLDQWAEKVRERERYLQSPDS